MAGFSRFGAVSRCLERKYRNGEPAGNSFAFALCDTVIFEITVPQGALSAELQITSDGTGHRRCFPMDKKENLCYAEIPMRILNDMGGLGLYFYKYRIETERGTFDMVTSPVDLSQSYADAQDGIGDLQLFLYQDREVLPNWFYGGVMYQIFPDRFFSSGKYPPKKEAILCRDPDEFPKHMRDRRQNDKNDLFFGGDLSGIEEKLDYLASLGVTCIYMNPIFSSPSSHRYNTADYMTVDEMLGGEAALASLIGVAKSRGIGILLDGVFNHTGSDSIYFNAEGRFHTVGAAQSTDSPYFPWYHFTDFPKEYEAWWGIRSLPRVMSDEPSYRAFLFGKNGVLRRYLRLGASGFRLDVADELSDDFLTELYQTAREEKPDALVLGEVWEDATTKISYGNRRKYLCGKEMDSVMNYPIRRAILDYFGEGNFMALRRSLIQIYGHYPKPAANALMNILGTHDTERAMTALGGISPDEIPYELRAEYRMKPSEYEAARERLCLATVVQMTLPGVPCIYYGDEAGMEGFGDPFCRMPFPWGGEDAKLTALVRTLGKIRREESVFREGDFSLVFIDADILCYERTDGDTCLVILTNRSKDSYVLHTDHEAAELIFGVKGTDFEIAPMSYAIVSIGRDTDYTVSVKVGEENKW